MFKIQVNSSDALLVEGNPMSDVSGLKDQIKKFILNRGADPTMSDSPEKAIISFKTDRGTTHRKFIEILDIIRCLLRYLCRASRVSNKEFREAASDPGDPAKKAIYDRGRPVSLQCLFLLLNQRKLVTQTKRNVCQRKKATVKQDIPTSSMPDVVFMLLFFSW